MWEMAEVRVLALAAHVEPLIVAADHPIGAAILELGTVRLAIAPQRQVEERPVRPGPVALCAEVAQPQPRRLAARHVVQRVVGLNVVDAREVAASSGRLSTPGRALRSPSAPWMALWYWPPP